VNAAGRCAAPIQKEAASPPRTFDKKAAAPGLGDAPREDTGPPLSVKAGCDRGTTANGQAAWRTYTRSLALSAEPPAAPRGRESGQAPACPRPGRGASGNPTRRTRMTRAPEQVELAFDSRKNRKNYTNPLTVSVHGSRGLPPSNRSNHKVLVRSTATTQHLAVLARLLRSSGDP
jgi:hypothetical protein